MAIKLNDGTILRNLEEQVQYLTNYHDVNQGLAQWGIRVIGQVETAAELPDPATFTGEYGDTYAVGTEAPFNFYIFTRAAIQGESPYWFPFGEISIVGPQGPKGDKGDTGETGASTAWYIGGSPNEVSNPKEGDLYLLPLTGQIFRYQQTSTLQYGWIQVGNIKGPQGIQGPQGPKGDKGDTGETGPMGPQGDAGGFINIWGILTNAGQLPTPASLANLTVAYLVGTTMPYDLYVQVGETSATAVWTNTGPFNAATAVSVGGVYQNVWNADTKLDRVTVATSYSQAYAKAPNGSQTQYNITSDVVNSAIAQRRSDGTIFVPTTTEYQNAAISKYQADNSYRTKYVRTAGETGLWFVYTQNQDGTDNVLQLSATATTGKSTIPFRDYRGCIPGIGTPENNDDAANKGYVDDKFLAKKTGIASEVIITQKPDGTTDNLAYSTDIQNLYMVRRTLSGDVLVNNVPVSPYGAVNKNYVDNNIARIHNIQISGDSFTLYFTLVNRSISEITDYSSLTDDMTTDFYYPATGEYNGVAIDSIAYIFDEQVEIKLTDGTTRTLEDLASVIYTDNVI